MFLHRKILSLIIVVCIAATLLAVTGTTATPAYAAAAQEPVTVSVDWSAVQSATTEYSFGLNTFKMFEPANFGNQTYYGNLQYMNTRFYRMHASEIMKSSNPADGKKSNSRGLIRYDAATGQYTWDAEKIKTALAQFTQANPNTTLLMTIPNWYSPSSADYPGWFATYDVKDESGKTITTLLDLSEHDKFAALCADLVRIINVEGGFGVKFWEPTNERDAAYYVPFNKSQLSNDKLDELITLYNKCAKAMKAVDPTIETGGLAFARGDLYDQVRRFVQGTKDEGTLDFVSIHFYASGDLMESDTNIYNRVNDPSDPNRGTLAKHVKDVRDILDREVTDRHIPLWLNEYNISWVWTNDDPRMHNHKGAVYDALALVYAHTSGADGTNAWNEQDGVYGKMTNGYALQSNAHAFQLFNNYLVGDRVAAGSGDESKIVPFAVINRETGARSYLVINRTDEVQFVRSAFDSKKDSGVPVVQHQISDVGYTIKNTDWDSITGVCVAVPANSVTVFTENTRMPTILPAPIAQLQPSDGSGPAQNPEPPRLTIKKEDTAASVNLTQQGNLDWIYFGYFPDLAQFVRKAGVGPDAALQFQYSGNNIVQKTGDSKKFSWTDGAPVTAGTDLMTGIATKVLPGDANKADVGQKFIFTAPADTGSRNLKISMFLRGAKVRVKATLNDGSAAPLTYTIDEAGTYSAHRTVTLNYRANSAGQTVTVECELYNKSWTSSFVTFHAASLSQIDTQAPTAPQGLEMIARKDNGVAVQWGASTDNMGVTGYDIYCGDKLVASTQAPTTNYYIQGLIPGKIYRFLVTARDKAGNVSQAGNVLTVQATPDLEYIRTLVRQYAESGDLKAPLLDQISNGLKQAEHQLHKKDTEKAVKHLEDVMKHIINPPMEDSASFWSRAVLYNSILDLKQALHEN